MGDEITGGEQAGSCVLSTLLDGQGWECGIAPSQLVQISIIDGGYLGAQGTNAEVCGGNET